MASTDIVAVEKVSLDLVYARAGSRDHELVQRIESLAGPRQVTYAEELGMGTSSYTLIKV